jgi:hypothetical protein
LGVLVILGSVVVDDVTENDWVKQRKNLIGRGEQQRDQEQCPVLARILVEKFHKFGAESAP